MNIKMNIIEQIQEELQTLQNQFLFKQEHFIEGAQGIEIQVRGQKLLNFCANNYLGLSSNPIIIQAAKNAMDEYGFGLSSVRFICGTQTLHKTLEQKIAKFLGAEDAILYAAAFDANGGLFEPLFHEGDAIISDQLNHASIIDGIRLSKAARYRYKNNDLNDLETQIKAAKAAGARRIVIATDGVFSMDGLFANLAEIIGLAKQYECLTMVDECHATGFIGKTGAGTAEAQGVFGQIDITTGTFGKALGGGLGGFTASHAPIVELLRQKSRPYLFSNALPPAIVGASIAALDLLEQQPELIQKIQANTQYFREKMEAAGFNIIKSSHPICAVMLGQAELAQKFAAELFKRNIYVKGFFYPVVPHNLARIRVQISAAHEQKDLDTAIAAFIEVGKNLGAI